MHKTTLYSSFKKNILTLFLGFFFISQAIASESVWDFTDLDLNVFKRGIELPTSDNIREAALTILEQESTYDPTEDLTVFTKYAGVFTEDTLFRLTANRVSNRSTRDQNILDRFYAAVFIDPHTSLDLKCQSLSSLSHSLFGDEKTSEVFNFILNNKDYPSLQRWNFFFSLIQLALDDLPSQEKDLMTIIHTSEVPDEYKTRAKCNLGKILGGLSDPTPPPQNNTPTESSSFFYKLRITYGHMMDGEEKGDIALRDLAKELYDELADSPGV